MKIDNKLLNSILRELALNYPGAMSSDAFNRVCANQTSAQKIAAHFQFLEDEGYIETHIMINDDEKPRGFEVNIDKTRIYSQGIQFINKGGFNS